MFLLLFTSLRIWRESLLQNEIKTELDRLSAELSEPSETASSTRQRRDDGKFSNCRIPTDIRKVCLNMAWVTDRGLHCPLEQLSKNCTLLKKLHGYEKPVEREEVEFPLAFGLKMHTSPVQAEQLLRAIYRPHNIYCIHVNKVADDAVFRVMTNIASCFPNVITTERVHVAYATYDSVLAEQTAMACALGSTVDWKYYLNLAGQEFPLRTNLEMVRILKMLNGTNDIESYPMPDRHQRRVTYSWVRQGGQIRNTSLPKRPPPFKVEIRTGLQYSSFSRAFVTTVFNDDSVRLLMDYFIDTYSPDETVWATVNQLPWIPGGYSFHVKHNPDNQHVSRAIARKYEYTYKCKGEYVRQVCIFTRADLPWLLRQPNLFANKFLLEMDSQAVACLEAVVNQRVRSRRVFLDHSYYSSLPHVRQNYMP
ncbi:hypothetical protein V1264_002132 [Littorina saxatilis]|uniref:Beta-1,3-galactosyl-O-glycosyl-glycoprotein beta-1,6-N-acetylglucosaminyltransferase n=2 Tax=Littorina saxatilis TaxID=31220 RepID=A0AAN9C4F2_9CAEN